MPGVAVNIALGDRQGDWQVSEHGGDRQLEVVCRLRRPCSALLILVGHVLVSFVWRHCTLLLMLAHLGTEKVLTPAYPLGCGSETDRPLRIYLLGCWLSTREQHIP